MSIKGKLYLIPCPIEENAIHTIPEYVVKLIHSLDLYLVEKAKTARHFIKRTQPPFAINTLEILELNKHEETSATADFIKLIESGRNGGLISEAGCPGVADPGAKAVLKAHEAGIEVVPLIGPSSILLALMGSGMNGQQFTFHGYLSPKAPELARDLKRLESQSGKLNQTQIFIEAPYRNRNVVEQVLKGLSNETLFCIAVDITGPGEFIQTKKVKDWKNSVIPDLHKRPALFLVYKG